MGSGDWFKTIINLKKVKEDKSKQVKGPSATEKSNGFKWRYRSRKESSNIDNGSSSGNPSVNSSGNPGLLVMPVEDIAATRIQTAFRAFKDTLKSEVHRMLQESVEIFMGPSATEKSNGFKWRYRSRKESSSIYNGSSSRNHRFIGMPVEDIAATRIQTAFRAFMARKNLRRLKGIVKFQVSIQGHTGEKQASTTLSYLHSWSKIQAEIRARRLCMVTEGRIRQKKLENQLKLEAKLHELEVEWCGGSDTMEEILSRIQQREEAAVKRERAMAYAFSHQWRANSNHNQGQVANELAKANWGWSWMERWIAARPWESRVSTQSISPKKVQSRPVSKVGRITNQPAMKISVSVKPTLSNGKGTIKARRLSYPTSEKPSAEEANTKEEKTQQEQLVF
ncbi:hypothetical protein HHK36_005075 [Tetracentron sinense]|uniref:Protein IQ-DOMAIN 1 n=1 Tax=Tetracentron sinense TaxID=13715 RepID=A0A834ZK80_TETSI|nr:hypothetical protein HHK36_005075 [Tetracentron sinense]